LPDFETRPVANCWASTSLIDCDGTASASGSSIERSITVLKTGDDAIVHWSVRSGQSALDRENRQSC